MHGHGPCRRLHFGLPDLGPCLRPRHTMYTSRRAFEQQLSGTEGCCTVLGEEPLRTRRPVLVRVDLQRRVDMIGFLYWSSRCPLPQWRWLSMCVKKSDGLGSPVCFGTLLTGSTAHTCGQMKTTLTGSCMHEFQDSQCSHDKNFRSNCRRKQQGLQRLNHLDRIALGWISVMWSLKKVPAVNLTGLPYR